MEDFTAGHISSEDGAPLIKALQKELGGKEVGGGTLEFHPGVQYRNILVWRGKSESSPFAGTKTQAPHDIPDKPVADYLPHEHRYIKRCQVAATRFFHADGTRRQPAAAAAA